MLSIGKVGLTRNQQLYYEEKVAKGAEDYYSGRGEVPGRWTGGAARELGLSGELGTEQLKAMMDGKHPLTGEQLAKRTSRCTVAALDLTFSAPKSISVLFALGDEQLSCALVEAHEEAVDAALGYLEREACRVRRGHNGTKAQREAGDPRGWQRARPEPAAGFVAAAYRHRMSRAQDPQLHTHVVCANMARGRDGRWTALDGHAIYEHAKAGGYVYAAHLRQAVMSRIRWAEWGPVREGAAELTAVPAAVREEFSQRRRRILEREQELQAAGIQVGFDGRERIAFDTREAKRDIREPDWRKQVRARAAEHGLGQTEVDRLTRLPASPVQRKVSKRALAMRLLGPTGLTATRNTFQKHDVVIAVAGEHADGARADEVAALAERLLEQPGVVPVGFALDRRYTTRELLEAESQIVGHAECGRGDGRGVLDQQQVRQTLEHLPRRLSEEQRRVVFEIASGGNRIDTIEALAGTGKTTSAGALREVYRQAGYQVLGAAPTARAVRELKERAGIVESRTLDGWALKLAAEPDALSFAAFTGAGVRRQPAVLIIDEAGMAHTRLSAEVIERAMAAEVKVVAIGDSGQLSSVQAGGWLGALTRRLGSHELREVMRQRDPHERRALAKVHRGEPDSYLELKRRRDELHLFGGDQPGVAAEEALIGRWAAACEREGTHEAVMICRDNARRERLNDLARAHLRETGSLGEWVEFEGRQWAVGDRVIARRNDRGRDLDNGTRGTIAAVDEHKGVIVRLDSGGMRQLDLDYLDRHVEHAYALTGHGMQGGTVRWSGVIGRPHDFSRNWSYTALSRAREPVEIFLLDEPTLVEAERAEIAPAQPDEPRYGPLARMAARMRERDDDDLALEQLEHVEPNWASRRERQDDPVQANETQPNICQPGGSPMHERAVSPLRTLLDDLEQRLTSIREELEDPVFEDARTLLRLQETIGTIEEEHERDRKPAGWRDRAGHQSRMRERENQLSDLHEHEARLLKRIPDLPATLARGEELRGEQRALGTEHRAVREQAIGEELATRPPWLENALGPEPQDSNLKDRWRKAAREIAGHRIDERVTDPETAVGQHARDHGLMRALADTRMALGVDAGGQEEGIGLE